MTGELDIIDRTVQFVKKSLSGAEGGHDWSHTERVWKLSRFIRDQEGRGDLMVIELSALLHDVSDPKFNDGDEEKGSQIAYNFLIKKGLPPDVVEHVQRIVRYVSFRGGMEKDRISSIEFQIVQDADRLDAMGAIGIARAFNYGGFRNRLIHDPSVPVREYDDPGSYHRSSAPTINHFYEKLLKLKGLMNTPTGKLLAEERHAFMLQFLHQFLKEWDPGKEN